MRNGQLLKSSAVTIPYFAIYSFEKLNPDFTGNCIRVDINGTEYNIGFVDGYIDLATLANLSNNFQYQINIIRWFDQSGFTRNLVYADVADRKPPIFDINSFSLFFNDSMLFTSQFSSYPFDQSHAIYHKTNILPANQQIREFPNVFGNNNGLIDGFAISTYGLFNPLQPLQEATYTNFGTGAISASLLDVPVGSFVSFFRNIIIFDLNGSSTRVNFTDVNGVQKIFAFTNHVSSTNNFFRVGTNGIAANPAVFYMKEMIIFDEFLLGSLRTYFANR